MPYGPDYFVYTGHTFRSVTSSAAPGVVALAPNPGRKAVYVFNDSPQAMYLQFATGSVAVVTSDNYTIRIPALSYYESMVPCPTGSVALVWAAASGSAKVTEVG